MPIRRPALFALAAVLSLGSLAAFAQEALPPVDPAIATMSVDQKVEARQKAMKQDGQLLRKAGAATGDAAVEAATTVLQNFINFPALFADGANNTKSKASSQIWQDFDKFSALFVEGQGHAAKMLAAAKAGDTATYQAETKSLAGLCFQCHQTYRID
jgi:cytochrome c556